MSFKNKNNYDRWVAYRGKMREPFVTLIDKNLNSIKERNFEDYLINGSDKNFHTQLDELCDEDFLTLEKIVNGWFDFQNRLDSFYSERIRRFNRYG